MSQIKIWFNNKRIKFKKIYNFLQIKYFMFSISHVRHHTHFFIRFVTLKHQWVLTLFEIYFLKLIMLLYSNSFIFYTTSMFPIKKFQALCYFTKFLFKLYFLDYLTLGHIEIIDHKVPHTIMSSNVVLFSPHIKL